ncbi:MAG TPA: hypothetical protein VKP08_05485, partial [Anaerolineales bacterium]|nr:hypothetical protein [Anaerolineales bacterium]
MKRILLTLPLFMFLLAACGAPTAAATPIPTETEIAIVPTNTEVAPVPTDAPTAAVPGAKLPAASFDAQTYIDEKFGFAFEYPSSWTVTEPTGGERGTQVQFLSSPDIANAATLPEGATRVSATVYNWDPKNDLAAYVAQRKTAWEASGFTILEEQPRTLELGLSAVQFTVQTPDATSVFLFAAIGDRYLELSGEGDLDLVKEIVQRVRPV